ncbi:hypothetical protein [Chlorella virus XW01]|nr:hypothetical protein [Chlorella virus XW01]
MSDNEEFSTPKPLNSKDIEKIYLDLKVLANLKVNCKLKTKNDVLQLDSYSFIQAIYRYYNNETRDKTIEFIEKIINDIDLIIPYLLDIKHKKEKANFIMIFPQVILGLDNLKKTYSGDENVKIKIDYFQECIRNYINSLI